MIDLSFLTEEEQEMILDVLRRDAELKKAEELRIQKLQKTVSDWGLLRHMTGEWFYETKQLRHQDRVHGCDIIRASMKQAQRPLTILELSQIFPEKTSFVSSENKEVFIPAVLCGVLQEPHLQLSNERSQNHDPGETLKDASKQTPTKQRKNPFNSEVIASHTVEEKESQLLDETVHQTQNGVIVLVDVPSVNDSSLSSVHMVTCIDTDLVIPAPQVIARETVEDNITGVLASCDSCISCKSGLNQDRIDSLFKNNALVVEPESENTAFSIRRQIDDPGGRRTNSAAPCVHVIGISKAGNGYSENTVSPDVTRNRPPPRKCALDSRDSDLSCKVQSELQEKEAAEHLIHDDVFEQHHSAFQSPAEFGVISAEEESGKTVHWEKELEQDCHSQIEAVDWQTRQNSHQLPEQSADIAVEVTSQSKWSSTCISKGSSHAFSTMLQQSFLGPFKTESDKTEEVKSPHKEEVTIRITKEQKNIQRFSQGTEDMTSAYPASVTEEAEPIVSTDVRKLQLTELQKSPLKETCLVDADTLPVSTRGSMSPQRLSKLKTLWERANCGSKIKFTREETKYSHISETRIEVSHGPIITSDMENINDDSPELKKTLQDTTDKHQEQNSLLQNDSRLLVDLSQEDEIYRANPVFIYETDDSLTASVTEHVSELQVNTSASSSTSFHTLSQEGNILVPLSKLKENISQGSPLKVSEKQKDINGLGMIFSSVNDVSSSSTLSHKMISPHLLRPFMDTRETSETEGPTSPRKTNSDVVLKSLIETEKGFGSQSPNGSLLRSSSGTWDLQQTSHPYQVKTDTQIEERPCSPCKSLSPRLKDQHHKVKRSPSKTCDPRVLPRESSWPKTTRFDRSPLKTFPINIDPPSIAPEDHHGKPAPVPRQRKIPSSETSPQSIEPSEKTVSHLTRSYIPQDYQYYLGPHQKTFVPFYYQEEAAAAESGVSKVRPWIIQNKDGNPSQVPKQLPSGRMSSSQENLTSQPASPPSDLTLSDSMQMKTSVSVPFLQLDETDSDSMFEPGTCRRSTGSSISNISLSLGMNSTSSISGSINSIYPADIGDIEVQGSIQFAVNYIQKLGEFHIFVVHCSDLAVVDTKKNRSDPYVKCYLLPDKSKLGKRKTSVKKKTSNPTFNEILRFKITMEVLKSLNLNISVWHNDTFGRNSFLGEVELDLSQWDFSNTQINEYMLKSRVSAHTSPSPPSCVIGSRGQMKVALRLLLQTSHSRTARRETGAVQIWVKDCRNLPPVRGVVINPFVKCTVLPDMSRKSQQRTRVVKRTANPMFNHTMVYDGFRPEDLGEACVEITVWDRDRLNNHYIGGLRLGQGAGKSYGVDVVWMDSTPDEANLWQRMLQSEGEWVEDVLPLRMLRIAKYK